MQKFFLMKIYTKLCDPTAPSKLLCKTLHCGDIFQNNRTLMFQMSRIAIVFWNNHCLEQIFEYRTVSEEQAFRIMEFYRINSILCNGLWKMSGNLQANFFQLFFFIFSGVNNKKNKH